MIERLVWNFNIENAPPLEITSFREYEKDSVKWEVRFFWPQSVIITLHGLSHQSIKLTQFEMKQHHDIYWIIPHTHYNIKERHQTLIYKPRLNKAGVLTAFGKKINLDTCEPDTLLPSEEILSAHALIERIKTQGQPVCVHKEALTYRFETKPAIKLELSRLVITHQYPLNILNNSTLHELNTQCYLSEQSLSATSNPSKDNNAKTQSYFSVCIEGRSKQLVEHISQHLIHDGQPSEYTDFLSRLIQS